MPNTPIEQHPLGFFLPENAKILMLGSFPPKQEKWSMHFYYPNIQNDMWRIIGLLFYNNKNHFLSHSPGKTKPAFDAEKIKTFCREKGLALGDTAVEIKRLKDNASDKFLEIVRPFSLKEVLLQIPDCHTIIVTGQKAMDTLMAVLHSETTPANKLVREPETGEFVTITCLHRTLRLYRMPSSSRAYPKPLEEKAGYYQKAFSTLLSQK